MGKHMAWYGVRDWLLVVALGTNIAWDRLTG